MSEAPSALVVREDSLAPAAVQARIAYAKSLAASSLLPDAYRQQPANVLLAIEYGQSLGIKPIAALNGINVIKGKPTMSADLMASVVRKAGHKLRIIQEGMTVRAQLVRADDPEFTYEVVWDEARARRAQLWGQRGPWSLYPEQMLRSRRSPRCAVRAHQIACTGSSTPPRRSVVRSTAPARRTTWGRTTRSPGSGRSARTWCAGSSRSSGETPSRSPGSGWTRAALPTRRR